MIEHLSKMVSIVSYLESVEEIHISLSRWHKLGEMVQLGEYPTQLSHLSKL